MKTRNGSLNIMISGDIIHTTVHDEDTMAIAYAEMDVEQVKTLCAMLEAALIHVIHGPGNAPHTRSTR